MLISGFLPKHVFYHVFIVLNDKCCSDGFLKASNTLLIIKIEKLCSQRKVLIHLHFTLNLRLAALSTSQHQSTWACTCIVFTVMCPHGKLWHCFCFSNADLCLCSIVHTTTRQAQGISLSCVAASCDSLVIKQWATLSASNTVQYFSKFAIKLFLLKVEITNCVSPIETQHQVQPGYMEGQCSWYTTKM